MARQNKKRPAKGARKSVPGRPGPTSSNKSRPATTRVPAWEVTLSAPIRPAPKVPVPVGFDTGSAKAARTVAHPGPAPLPPLRATPPLAKVGGAAGVASALEFASAPFAFVGELRPHALGVTYWFDPPVTGGPYEVVVRLTGRRLDVAGARTPADDFVAVASLRDVQAHTGRTSLTHRVHGKAPGRWHVTAEAMAVPNGGDRADPVRLPSAEAVGSSTFAPVASGRAPGVVVGAWPVMVGLGVLLALALQSSLAPVHGLTSPRVMVLALVATVLGALGAKLYYRLTHLGESGGHSFAGLSVQGFVIVATGTFVAGGALQGMVVGHLLDATVPALLLGQAVGRLGCLLGGCCAGVPARSRWAVWSSDRRIGTRRVPVQLLESAAAGLLALVTGAIAQHEPTPFPAGLLFVAGLAAYVIVRQLLFPLRGIPRATRRGRQATLAAALLTLVGTAIASSIA